MITEVTLKNFKSFKDATVPLGPFSLVVGANGAGKSNLFDALRFLHFIGRGSSIRDAIEGHASPSATAVAVPGIRGGSKFITHIDSDSPVFEIGVTMSTPNDVISYRICVNALTYQVEAECLASQRHPWTYVFDTHPGVAPPQQDGDSPLIYARFYKKNQGTNPKRGFSRHESVLSQFSGRAAESTLNEGVGELARRELGTIKPLELRPEVLRQYSSLGQFEMGEHGENFAALVWLLDRRTRWTADDDQREDAEYRMAVIQSWLSELTPHPVEQVKPEEAPTGEVIFALREKPFTSALTARSLSDGTLRFAALTFEVFSDDQRRTLVIEEIENGINPARLSLLVRMLQTATDPTMGVQVIASTHAPGVLDFASAEVIGDSVLVAWDEEERASTAARLTELEGLADALKTASLGELQSDGWFQLAAETR